MTDAPEILQANPHTAKTPSEEKNFRPILTFMRRSSPLSNAQQQGLADYAHLIVKAPISDARTLFENPNQPLTIEIGFGMGGSLVQMAKDAPERNFLGIEVHIPGIAQCAYDAGQAGIKNLLIMDADALEVLAGIPDGSVDRVQLFFPDPWQKKRHHKRRFVAPERMALIVQKLTQGGWFHAATDWQPYSEWMIDVLEQVTELENVYGKAQFAPRPDWRPKTKFERRGEVAGHGVWDVIYKRV
ncbi:MAG: tRNA (guanosine(46)-N7)-methyltransferase TrmB [Gammaproteobacteria bacterium]|nr:tRNA (guanosine(46)-N7)-methyltransferase TrmB [Gammaproteobacteria bacterium]